MEAEVLAHVFAVGLCKMEPGGTISWIQIRSYFFFVEFPDF
jgi:hypothetical protein